MGHVLIEDIERSTADIEAPQTSYVFDLKNTERTAEVNSVKQTVADTNGLPRPGTVTVIVTEKKLSVPGTALNKVIPGVTSPGSAGNVIFLNSLWLPAYPNTLAHEIGHVGGYVGDDLRKEHSIDEEHVMYDLGGKSRQIDFAYKDAIRNVDIEIDSGPRD